MDSEIEKVIDRMFSDMSVPQRVTWERLQEIIEHCRMLQESLDEKEG